MHMIAGFSPPSRASSTSPAANLAKPGDLQTVGLVPERDSVYAFLTGEEFVVDRQAASAGRPGRGRRAVEMLDMADAAGRKISTYSKGMRQRIKVAAARATTRRSRCSTSRSTGWSRGSGCT